jgi:2-oxoglutarate ferredoxin oxidoreductase subunit delta
VLTGLRWDGDEPVLSAAPPRVVIDRERCKGCLLCLEVCPPRVLGLGGLNTQGYQVVVLLDNERCTSCTACAIICPESAVFVYRAPRPRVRVA